MTELEGIVEQIIFYNQDNYYTVAKLKQSSGKQVTIVGNLPPLFPEEVLSLKGEWVKHKEYGEQFQVAEWKRLPPKTLLGIERFLASGLIKGIGKATAEKIVREFGLESLEIIVNTPERLAEIPGISVKKALKVGASLEEHAAIQRIMVFLQGIGISPAYALKIYRVYGDQAVNVVSDNPYQLADDVFGIGFKIADQIAGKLGIDKDSPYRIRAGIRYLLNEVSSEGHVYAVEKDFLNKAGQELGVNELQLAAEVEELILGKEVFRESVSGITALYLAPFYYSEAGAAAKIRELLSIELERVMVDPTIALREFSVKSEITLAPKQQEAVINCLKYGMMVITGGPGTGKTTIIKAIIQLFNEAKMRVLLAAPTGRAAKRLAETTGQEAKTIHRLLGYGNDSKNGGRFQHNEKEPLAAEVLIIDEFSMVDLPLFYNLLKAINPGTRLIMVGDVDQLPSVGPGSVLRDLIQSQCIPTVRLNVIFRQAEKSLIVSNAHKINRGEFPYLSTAKDFFFIPKEDPEQIVQTISDLIKNRISKYLQCDPLEDIQVLSPMRRTVTGVENLNHNLQNALNPPQTGKGELKVGANVFRVGDKVMQLKNDYQKLVFNGDIGRVGAIDSEERSLSVVFQDVDGERTISYETEELDQLVLAYAISVHKSQGNEYPVVIMPVTTQHFLMLQRNLLYTAVTRAKKMVVIIGTKKAIAIAVKNNRIEERHSLLPQRIRAALAGSW
jgi:exodeoxyribonuclease V alpha subunit